MSIEMHGDLTAVVGVPGDITPQQIVDVSL